MYKRKLKAKIIPLVARNFYYPIGAMKCYNKLFSRMKLRLYLLMCKKLENRKNIFGNCPTLVGNVFKF